VLYDILINLLQRACVLGRRCAVCVIPHSCGGPAQGQSSCFTYYWISCVPCAHSTGIVPGSIRSPSVPSKKQGMEVLFSVNHMDIFLFILIMYTEIYFAAIIVFLKNFKVQWYSLEFNVYGSSLLLCAFYNYVHDMEYLLST
jgi:hypothetical protein